jgi:hypothetical protein
MSLRRYVFPVSLTFLCLWVSCSRTNFSEAVASSSRDSYEPRVVEPPVDGLSVRPDVLVVPFTFQQEEQALEKGVPKLRTALDGYVRAAAEATKAEVTVKLKNFGRVGGYDRKLVGNEGARLVGQLEVALPESLDFWGRAERVAALVRVGGQQMSAAAKAEGGLDMSIGFPTARVRDPEARRAELTRRWVERVRVLTTQAQSEKLPLHVVSCEPPGEVKQQELSVDEVVLSLTVSCQLGSVAP